jgi:hypothetical protein
MSCHCGNFETFVSRLRPGNASPKTRQPPNVDFLIAKGARPDLGMLLEVEPRKYHREATLSSFSSRLNPLLTTSTALRRM